MIQQTNQPITFEVFYTASKQSKTGLTVTVDIYNPSGTLIVSAGAATETGGGFYRYTLAGTSTATGGAYRAVFKTSDSSVDLQHVPSLWEVGVAGVDYLDIPGTVIYNLVNSTRSAAFDASSQAQSAKSAANNAYNAINNLQAPIYGAYNAVFCASGSAIVTSTTPITVLQFANSGVPSKSKIGLVLLTSANGLDQKTFITAIDRAANTITVNDPISVNQNDVNNGTINVTVLNQFYPDVAGGLAAQGYTTSRASKLDNLNATISSRLATSAYIAPVAGIDYSADIAAIKIKTDNLPLDPASNTQVQTRLASSSYTAPDNASIVASKTAAESVNDKLTDDRATKLDRLTNLDASVADTYEQAQGALNTAGAVYNLLSDRIANLDRLDAPVSMVAQSVWEVSELEGSGFYGQKIIDTANTVQAKLDAPVSGVAQQVWESNVVENQGQYASQLLIGSAITNAYLDTPVSSRLAAEDYVSGGGGSGGGSSVRLVQGPFHLYSDATGSDDVVEATTGDAITLALYLRDGNNEPIPYSSGTLTASLRDAFGAVSIATVAITEINPDFGIAQVQFNFTQRGRFKLSVKRNNGPSDIVTFGPMAIHVTGATIVPPPTND